ncbi:hypothetical protein IYC_10439 [Clostridium sporogenes PA 3679]|nr:hypothetical protein IYC_10439 [Clostridium sporogenes PA 3679]
MKDYFDMAFVKFLAEIFNASGLSLFKESSKNKI